MFYRMKPKPMNLTIFGEEVKFNFAGLKFDSRQPVPAAAKQ
jgi:hypothetical protein